MDALHRDQNWFKSLSTNTFESSSGEKWVLRFNALKKIYRLLNSYYEEVLGHDTSSLDVPNLTLIARDSNENEVRKLGWLVICAAVLCPLNQKYILKIQGLDKESQHDLMIAIEDVCIFYHTSVFSYDM
jgi:protein HOOK3